MPWMSNEPLSPPRYQRTYRAPPPHPRVNSVARHRACDDVRRRVASRETARRHVHTTAAPPHTARSLARSLAERARNADGRAPITHTWLVSTSSLMMAFVPRSEMMATVSASSSWTWLMSCGGGAAHARSRRSAGGHAASTVARRGDDERGEGAVTIRRRLVGCDPARIATRVAVADPSASTRGGLPRGTNPQMKQRSNRREERTEEDRRGTLDPVL